MIGNGTLIAGTVFFRRCRKNTTRLILLYWQSLYIHCSPTPDTLTKASVENKNIHQALPAFTNVMNTLSLMLPCSRCSSLMKFLGGFVAGAVFSGVGLGAASIGFGFDCSSCWVGPSSGNGSWVRTETSPLVTSINCVARWRTKSVRCVTSTTARPFVRSFAKHRWTMISAVCWSNAERGSSKSRILDLLYNALARETLARCPPDNPIPLY